MKFIEKDSGLNGMVCSIYEVDGKKHYLSLRENQVGLNVLYLEEIIITSDVQDELVNFKDVITQKTKRMHPVLLNILKEDWEMYIDIVEGVPEAWESFKEKLVKFEKTL